jgi:adenosine kinase
MSILVTGSIAVDHIMVFQGRFKDRILPDQVHVLNVSFHVPTLRKSWGGCGANIAYNLRLLGGEPLLLGTVGRDFGGYAVWLDSHGISRDHVLKLEDEYMAQAFITTDLDDNQITAFHSGAMDRAHEARIADIDASLDLAIVSPNGKRAMQEYTQELKQRGVELVVDPGQGLGQFERDELRELIDGASVYVVNDYEWSLTLERSDWDEDAIAERVGAIVVTLGAEGCRVRRGDERLEVRAVQAESVVDPTGCGDAFRAGLLYGRSRGFDLVDACRVGSLLGSLKVTVSGPQGLELEAADFRARFESEFGSALE